MGAWVYRRPHDYRFKNLPVVLHPIAEPPVSVVAETPALQANRTSFTRKLLEPLQLDTRPETPPPVSVVAETPALQANRTAFARTLLAPLQLDTRPETALLIPPAAFIPVPKANRTAFDRQLLPVLNPHVYPQTPKSTVDFAGHTPVRQLKTRFIVKRIPVLNPHVYPATPAGFFDGFYPGSRRVEPLRSAYERRLLTPPEHNEYPRRPVELAHRPAVNRTSFTRKLQRLPHPELPTTPPPTPPQPAVVAHKHAYARTRILVAHNPAYPPTPPSIIIGDARWAMRALYRRDIERVIQPVWNPASIVSGGFSVQETDCQWTADCALLVWTADEECL